LRYYRISAPTLSDVSTVTGDAGMRSVRHDRGVEGWAAVGLGLDYGVVRLSRTTKEWLAVGSVLRDSTAALLGADGRVEQIGSSSVVGLLAKPIIDLAVGLVAGDDLDRITASLGIAGWAYRGDAGDSGGHVFILDSQPSHRVAHLHAVELLGTQWIDYLRLRDLLRSSPSARRAYEEVKVRLAEDHADDREAYTEGKTDVVRALLGIAG
jgi:GrpB-like predicted nucleotidyltransferase (UPF0157 family)